jgi:hypothetical protein
VDFFIFITLQLQIKKHSIVQLFIRLIHHLGMFVYMNPHLETGATHL